MTDADLRKFFLSQLALAKPQVSPFVLMSADAQRTSYFVDVLEPESIVSQEDMITSLVDIWRQLGLDTLVSLEPELRKIAKALRAPEMQGEAVPNFVYAMY